VDEQFRNLELNPPDLFPVLIEGNKISKEPSHESCLRAFWKKLNLLKTSGFSGDTFSLADPEPFDKAIGGYGTFRWIKLKEIVDEDLHFPEDAEAERALKDGWTHTTRPLEDKAVTKTAQEHLTEFFAEYDDHHDFERARDVHGSARYVALVKLKNKPDVECSDRELRLKELWVVTEPFRSVPRELRVILMDIIENPESSRDEALAAWYRKITGEPETQIIGEPETPSSSESELAELYGKIIRERREEED